MSEIKETELTARIKAIEAQLKPLYMQRRGRGWHDQDLTFWCAGCGARSVNGPNEVCGCRMAPVADAERTRPPAPPPPVNRDATTLTDGSPVASDHREIDPGTGMQKGYVVLSNEERAKGFVRPVRRSYRHIGIRPKYPLRDLAPDELEKNSCWGYVKYEEYPDGSPERVGSIVGRFWTQAQLTSGCGGITTMGQALAETYARDPKFYGGTFCATCRKHFPVGADGEFDWLDDPGVKVGT